MNRYAGTYVTMQPHIYFTLSVDKCNQCITCTDVYEWNNVYTTNGVL